MWALKWKWKTGIGNAVVAMLFLGVSQRSLQNKENLQVQNKAIDSTIHCGYCMNKNPYPSTCSSINKSCRDAVAIRPDPKAKIAWANWDLPANQLPKLHRIVNHKGVRMHSKRDHLIDSLLKWRKQKNINPAMRDKQPQTLHLCRLASKKVQTKNNKDRWALQSTMKFWVIIKVIRVWIENESKAVPSNVRTWMNDHTTESPKKNNKTYHNK